MLRIWVTETCALTENSLHLNCMITTYPKIESVVANLGRDLCYNSLTIITCKCKCDILVELWSFYSSPVLNYDQCWLCNVCFYFLPYSTISGTSRDFDNFHALWLYQYFTHISAWCPRLGIWHIDWLSEICSDHVKDDVDTGNRSTLW